MGGDNGASTLAQAATDATDINCPRFVSVNRNRSGAAAQGGSARCNRAKIWYNYLITWANLRRRHSQIERTKARCDKNMLHAHNECALFLKILNYVCL